jgi:hypothetical protein
MRALRIFPAALALAATPAAAESELGFTLPAEICIEERADAEIAGTYLGSIIDRSFPKDKADKLQADFTALADACIAKHGELSKSPLFVIELVVAKILRNEAMRRLAARGVDPAWLSATVDRARIAAGGDFNRTMTTVGEALRDAPLEVVPLNIEGLGILVSGYTHSTIRMARLMAQTSP